jgi:hypothetical protein
MRKVYSSVKHARTVYFDSYRRIMGLTTLVCCINSQVDLAQSQLESVSKTCSTLPDMNSHRSATMEWSPLLINKGSCWIQFCYPVFLRSAASVFLRRHLPISNRTKANLLYITENWTRSVNCVLVHQDEKDDPKRKNDVPLKSLLKWMHTNKIYSFF